MDHYSIARNISSELYSYIKFDDFCQLAGLAYSIHPPIPKEIRLIPLF